MAIVQQIALESNRKIRMDFEGGELSSDGGLLLLKELFHRLGLKPLLRKCFHTTDNMNLWVISRVGINTAFYEFYSNQRFKTCGV